MSTTSPSTVLRAAWKRCTLDERRDFIEEISRSWDPYPLRVGALVSVPGGRSGIVTVATGDVRTVRVESKLLHFAVADLEAVAS